MAKHAFPSTGIIGEAGPECITPKPSKMLTERNALITSTSLGGGIFTFWLNLDYGDGGHQGAGGIGLDTYSSDARTRIGTAFGLDFIIKILETVGIETWEELPGKHIRVRGTDDRIYAIGHILRDRWLDFDEFCKEHK